MELKAYPKVNLCLKVYKEMSESKHKIDSIMCLYKKMHDTIYIKKSNDLYISYKDDGKEIFISDCIVSRSLRYLQNKYDIDINYRIKIVKRIPFGSGFGGGSSDAAAVINYILSKNKPIHLDLKEIAIEIGSDIPFFLTNYLIARVREVGDYVTPIYNWKPKFTVDTNGVICSTTQVFKQLDNDSDYVSRVNVDKIIESHLYKQHYKNVVYNDLTKYIIQNYKELQKVYSKYNNQSFFTGAGSSIVTLKELKYEN